MSAISMQEKETIKAKVQVAKTQERMNKMMSGIGDSSASLDAFSRMEAKADAMLDKANAMSELNSSSADSIDDLASKYDAAQMQTFRMSLQST